MPRISQDQTQERHAFLLELFRSQPDLSRQEAMDMYKDRFGASLNAKTFSELREQAQREGKGSHEEEKVSHEEEKAEEKLEERTTPELAVEDTASRLKAVAAPELMSGASAQAPKRPKARAPVGAGQKNVFVDAHADQLQFLERVVNQLQDAGANNLRIDYSTDRWMVLTVETK